jgi:hypothetical protein
MLCLCCTGPISCGFELQAKAKRERMGIVKGKVVSYRVDKGTCARACASVRVCAFVCLRCCARGRVRGWERDGGGGCVLGI